MTRITSAAAADYTASQQTGKREWAVVWSMQTTTCVTIDFWTRRDVIACNAILNECPSQSLRRRNSLVIASSLSRCSDAAATRLHRSGARVRDARLGNYSERKNAGTPSAIVRCRRRHMVDCFCDCL